MSHVYRVSIYNIQRDFKKWMRLVYKIRDTVDRKRNVILSDMIQTSWYGHRIEHDNHIMSMTNIKVNIEPLFHKTTGTQELQSLF